ncbi:hypothetical protein EVAR_95797_1 [Eumeta japonica]|uniref:Uncharacterized protein n=1 Tax=Eumeta variegata TaxID=151549 RepID=A0A4C1W0S7_EUMVA|nr:hypothetical protein EVAR_95797_1 [Eumeta japonica]
MSELNSSSIHSQEISGNFTYLDIVYERSRLKSKKLDARTKNPDAGSKQIKVFVMRNGFKCPDPNLPELTRWRPGRDHLLNACVEDPFGDRENHENRVKIDADSGDVNKKFTGHLKLRVDAIDIRVKALCFKIYI